MSQSKMGVCGGHSEAKPITSNDELQSLVLALKQDAESKLSSEFPRFEATHVRSQVVAGMVYHFRIVIGDNDDDVVHMKVFKPLPHTGDSPSIMEIKKAEGGHELALM
mmetsp:Transcript_27030/g.41053  ORF Transcript_27030/g.41053 Transcript_27030/m.41053 type:complete len:108 (-) Transcript_27030:117-440(-)